MLLSISLPWTQTARLGRSFDVFRVEIERTEYEGEVYTTGQAVSLLSGEAIRLPTYLAEKDIAGFLASQLGADFLVTANGRLD